MFFKYFLKQKTKVKNVKLDILNKKTFFWIPFSFIAPFIVVITMFTIIPFIYTVINSLHPLKDSELASSAEFSFSEFTHLLFDNETFAISVKRSFIYALLSLPVTLFISLLISSAIAHIYKKWAKGFWQTVFFLPYITSGIAISLTFAYLFDSQTGLINNWLGLNIKWLDSGNSESAHAFFVIFINGIFGSLPFQILILTTAMLSVDKNIYKAASIDGASNLTKFFRITLPTIKPTLNFLITIGIIGSIKAFPLALFQNKVSEATLNGGNTIMIYIFEGIQKGNYSKAGAATLILFLITITMSVVLKSGIKLIINISNKWGEHRVVRKITASKKI